MIFLFPLPPRAPAPAGVVPAPSVPGAGLSVPTFQASNSEPEGMRGEYGEYRSERGGKGEGALGRGRLRGFWF